MGLFNSFTANHKDGYSLIEILVIVAIIGIIAAIAVPAYNNYQIKSKIGATITMLNSLAQDAIIIYQRTGSFPSQMTYNGATSSNSSWEATTSDTDNVRAFLYNYNSKATQISFALGDNFSSIPGFYTNSVTPTGADKSAIVLAIRDMGNGVLKTVCGRSNVNGYVPIEYLPSTCQCSNVSNFYTNGTGGC